MEEICVEQQGKKLIDTPLWWQWWLYGRWAIKIGVRWKKAILNPTTKKTWHCWTQSKVQDGTKKASKPPQIKPWVTPLKAVILKNLSCSQLRPTYRKWPKSFAVFVKHNTWKQQGTFAVPDCGCVARRRNTCGTPPNHRGHTECNAQCGTLHAGAGNDCHTVQSWQRIAELYSASGVFTLKWLNRVLLSEEDEVWTHPLEEMGGFVPPHVVPCTTSTTPDGRSMLA